MDKKKHVYFRAWKSKDKDANIVFGFEIKFHRVVPQGQSKAVIYQIDARFMFFTYFLKVSIYPKAGVK